MIDAKRGRIASALGIALVAFALALGLGRNEAAADTPGGFTGTGQLVVASVVAGAKVTVGGNIALEQRGTDFRIDVLSLGFPGADAGTSALLGAQLFPPGGFTVVAHGGLNDYTVWSSASKKYYTAKTTAPGGSPTPAPTPTPAASTTGGIPIFKSLTDLKAFSVTIALTGHATTNGHPTTGLAYQFTRVEKNGDPTDIHGNIAIADDLDGIPVELTASAKSKTIPESALKIDLTSVSKQAPSEGDFDVPVGYTRAASLGEVIGRTLPAIQTH